MDNQSEPIAITMSREEAQDLLAQLRWERTSILFNRGTYRDRTTPLDPHIARISQALGEPDAAT